MACGRQFRALIPHSFVLSRGVFRCHIQLGESESLALADPAEMAGLIVSWTNARLILEYLGRP